MKTCSEFMVYMWNKSRFVTIATYADLFLITSFFWGNPLWWLAIISIVMFGPEIIYHWKEFKYKKWLSSKPE